MNWRRGLLRLWAVLAVLWIGFAYLGEEPVAKWKMLNDPIVIEYGEFKLQFPANISKQEMHRALTEFVRQPPSGPWSKFPPVYPEKIAAELMPNYDPHAAVKAMARFAAIALLPPLALLALGWVAWWIGRGFRPAA